MPSYPFTILRRIVEIMKESMQIISFILFTGAIYTSLTAQEFHFGNDLSYVNEMEDCGVIYQENSEPKDPYKIFADHNTTMVRLRLWHTPAWYDSLNDGNRYSDLADVKRSIARARAEGMAILLDFHLSDNWADPGKQVVPAAWAAIVDDLPVLQDSLYGYIYSTLNDLYSEGLLPEMIQIGNETNKGILQSQQQNDSGWWLDWDRNSALFNTAIDAVKAVENETDMDVKIAIHAAGPQNATWLFEQFIDNGVTEFDVMGISYYWAWHQPTSIDETGDIIEGLLSDYPGYQVMIFETGYIWTFASNDNANNIINEVHPDYTPTSPQAQRDWLIDLTEEVIASGGSGVFYWEPAWVSSECWTQWGQGSHQENAAFFDFKNNLHSDGGIAWMTHDYGLSSSVYTESGSNQVTVITDSIEGSLIIRFDRSPDIHTLSAQLTNMAGQFVVERILELTPGSGEARMDLPDIPFGVYVLSLTNDGAPYAATKVWIDRK